MGSHGQGAWPRGLVNTGMGLHEQLVCSRRRSVCRCAFTVMVGTLEGLAELTTTDCVQGIRCPKRRHTGETRSASTAFAHCMSGMHPALRMPILCDEIMTLCADHTCPNDALASRFSATAQPAILPRGQIGFPQLSMTTGLQNEPVHADAARGVAREGWLRRAGTPCPSLSGGP